MRRHDDPKVAQLAALPLFAQLRDSQLRGIAQLCTRLELDPGTVLCREGSAGHEFFVVVEGTATVSRGGRDVAAVGPGDFVGELALLDAGPRLATVTADTRLAVLVLTSSEFATLLADDPEVAVRMLPAIGARWRNAARDGGGPVDVSARTADRP